MAVSRQELLREAWLGGSEGTMSAQTEARAWSLREAWRDEGKPSYGMLTYIASKVYKIVPPMAKKEHPTPSALHQLFQKIDNDKGWFPGKSEQVKHGPAPAINGTNQSIIARSAMTMKERGEEPTYGSVVAHNPKASLNPKTKGAVSPKALYKVLRKRCYDDANDPDDTWTHDSRYSKEALTEDQIAARWAWSKMMKRAGRRPNWYYQKLIWTDLCNSILPRTRKRHQEMTLARKGKKGWGSKKSRMKSKSLRKSPSATKQTGYEAIKVYWAPVLTRGKLHIEILGESSWGPGENAASAAALVKHVRHAVNQRFQCDGQPSVLFVDRGQGFYSNFGGKITKKFKDALQEHSFTAFNGDDASSQPGSLQEVMLHETAVAWIRHKEVRNRNPKPWEETVAQFGARMKEIARDINQNYDVEGLCWKLPHRLDLLDAAEGDRIKP